MTKDNILKGEPSPRLEKGGEEANEQLEAVSAFNARIPELCPTATTNEVFGCASCARTVGSINSGNSSHEKKRADYADAI